MRDAVELNIGGIKCDVCDYVDMTVKVQEYPEWLNKPCPKCGANLLTEEDFNNVQAMLQLTSMFNQIFPKQEGEETVKVSAKMNGTGAIEFQWGKPQKDEEK